MVRRKHSRFGAIRFGNDIAAAVQSLASFKETETMRIQRMMTTDISQDQAYALILRAFERSIISSTVIEGVLKEWNEPSHDYGEGRTLWHLLNAFTTVLGPRAVKAPAQYAGQTMRLSALLAPEVPKGASAA